MEHFVISTTYWTPRRLGFPKLPYRQVKAIISWRLGSIARIPASHWGRATPDYPLTEDDHIMKIIPLSQNQVAIIDDEDFELVSRHKWCAHWKRNISNFYAATSIRKPDGKRAILYLHQLLMETPSGMETDHILSQATLDNRRDNLRICSHSQNQLNTAFSTAPDTIRTGVHWRKDCKKWQSRISVEGKRIHLGYFDAREDALSACRSASIRIHGDFARAAIK